MCDFSSLYFEGSGLLGSYVEYQNYYFRSFEVTHAFHLQEEHCKLTVKAVHLSATSRINNFVAQLHKTEDLNHMFSNCLKIALSEDQRE